MATHLTMAQIVKVCIPHTHRDYFDYLPADTLPLAGSRVLVPFRNKIRVGIVIGSGETEQEITTLKTIERLFDEDPLLTPSLLELCHWVSRYYQSPLSEVLPLALPKNYRLGKEAQLAFVDYFQLALPAKEALHRLNPRARKQQQLLAQFTPNARAVSKRELQKAGFTSTLLTSLCERGILECRQEVALPMAGNRSPEAPLALNEEQQSAVEKITANTTGYHCYLLQGVTGSGKTEVYLQVMSTWLSLNRQILVLVPEIGLTPQLIHRFNQRLSVPMAVIHSGLNEQERQQAWHLAKIGAVNVVIGTRTAVFTPMPHLGLIIIDEEHDPSLKQGEGVRYSARDTALMRAHLAGIPILLGSATPSLESLQNSLQGKYSLLRLNQKALNQSPLHIQITDLRNVPLNDGLADSTLKTMAAHLNEGNQVLVFINRRGYAPVLLCHQCGWMADCRACDSHLTLHRQRQQLLCHHCGLSQAIPSACKQCKSRELVPVGVGTQRLYDYLSQHFPTTRVLRIDRDEVRKKNELDERLAQIHRGEAQLIIGTQMLAKGHHFPGLTLVVIVDVDAGFYNQDFRALERLGQLLTQVAGRAGRADKQGQVIIQTHFPTHPLLNTLVQKGYDAFAEALLTSRQQAALPPYHYLAVIRAQDKKPASLLQFLHAVKNQLQGQSIDIMGPAPAPLPRKANQYRMQLLLKSSSRKLLQQSLTTLREWLTINKSHNVRWNIDVDPMDLT